MSRILPPPGCFKKWNKVALHAVLFAVVLLLAYNKANATHAAGADLTYRCLGGLVYQVEATFYRDCGGTPEPGNLTITYKSASCAYSRTAIANKVVVDNGIEITMPCNTSPSSCNGGFSTGLRKWVYRATVTLPYACADWVFSYRVCCRNCTVTTIQSPCASNSELYVEAGLNNIVAGCNNSPQFSNLPIAFVCLGQNFNYNQGVYDLDGDSLSYELITPKISATGEITWLAPATRQQPLASSTPFTINAVTGDINFTPAAMQIGILAVRVNEFRAGNLIGSTIRDMQVYTQNCFNTIPAASGMNGSNDFTATACAGQPVCFTIHSADIDSTQSVVISYNNIPQGAVVTETTGSRPSLEFCWTPSQADVSRIPKVFTITVRDNACPYNGVQTFSYAILVGGPQLTLTSTDPTCSGMNNGTATVSGAGMAGSSINWNTSPPQTASTATGLNPGNYEVVVTDFAGCISAQQVTINPSSNVITVEATGSGVITCQSGNIGQAQATITGGQAPFTYMWSNGMSTPAITGLGSGSYTVTIQDANGCSDNDTVAIQQVSGNVVAMVASITNVNCYAGNSGAAAVTATGGNGPYNFLWSNGATAASVQDLSAGNYSVTVSDINGCSAQISIVIDQPQQGLTYNQSTVNPVSCYGGSDGSFIVVVNGGVAPYTYAWSTGATSPSLYNLPAGNYVLTVTDANGCGFSIAETIQQPSTGVNIALDSIENIICSGGNNGTIEVHADGGNGPYSYLWSNGSVNNSLSGLTAGNYTCTVTDANGCSVSTTQVIEEPELPVTVVVTNVNHLLCNQGTGSIDISSTGGTLPLQYIWSTGAVTEDINNLQPGWYTLSVTDANGCLEQTSIEVKNIGNALSIQTGHIQDVLCYNMSNGIIDLNVSGGNAPYTFQWSNGGTAGHIQNLSAGVYAVTVTDADGCSSNASYTISQPAAPLIPQLTIQQLQPCASVPDGAITLQVNGGVSPYSFSWSNGATVQNVSGLTAGTYSVTVTDANGCNAIISGEVLQQTGGLMGSIVLLNPVSCFGGSNGAAVCNIAGGTGPYVYQWSNGAGSSELTGAAAGSYTVTVTDISGCTYAETIMINQPVAPVVINGTTGIADCLNNTGASINTTISGGALPYTYLWNNSQITPGLINAMPGAYTVTVTDANGCTAQKTFNIDNNSQLSLSASGPLTICAGEMVTMYADTTSGGSYQWYFNGNILNGATGSSFTTPASGAYTVSLTNACGTFSSDTLKVIVKSIGNVSVSNAQIICPPETATLIATGGVTYSWTPASYITFTNVADPIVSPQVTTVYTVEIANEFGCKTSLNTNVAVICDSLLVPTGFSPNDDGVNDGYVVDGIEEYPGNKLWVYNRWGKLVYKATDYMNSWNGVSNISGIYMGKKVPTGTYYYILDLNDRSKPRAGYLIIRH